MRAIKYCPYCGNPQVRYYDPEYPGYAWCGCCKTWITAGYDFEEREVAYIIQKLRMIPKTMAALKEATEAKE